MSDGVTLRALYLTETGRLWMVRKRLLLLRSGGQVGRRDRRSWQRARGAGLVGAKLAPAGALKWGWWLSFAAAGRGKGGLLGY